MDAAIMKILTILFGVLLAGNCFAQTPSQIGGIRLDTDIGEYKDYIKPQTTLPIRFMEYLDEVEVKSVQGFKSGYIAYGNCAQPGNIVRIKLKYKDSSKAFFKELFKKYKSSLGKPSEWLGDSFHIVTAWKWTFSEGDERVDLYLQHNLSDRDQKIGTSMKLTMTSLIEKEQKCFTEKYPGFREVDDQVAESESNGWEGLVPE
jgi:hypothetical protein